MAGQRKSGSVRSPAPTLCAVELAFFLTGQSDSGSMIFVSCRRISTVDLVIFTGGVVETG